jgi:glycerophosphoryl diester phosphodiesterase
MPGRLALDCLTVTLASTVTAREAPGAIPFVVAHRAGNDLVRLRRAEALGISLIEADVHLFGGRLEVRHLKTAGPLPILWDRWRVAPPWTPRLLVRQLLAAAKPGTELMLDLKGRDMRLSRDLAQALDFDGMPRRVTVCARDWRLLEPLAGRADVRLVHSVGNGRQLRLLARERRLGGVSIHRRLLDASVARELRGRAGLLLSWPVETVAEARRLASWGVDGLITQSFERLAPAFGNARLEAPVG